MRSGSTAQATSAAAIRGQVFFWIWKIGAIAYWIIAMQNSPVIISVSRMLKGPRNCSGTINCWIEGSVSQMPVQAGRTMPKTIVMLRPICRRASFGPRISWVATAIWNRTMSSAEPTA